MAYFHPQKSDNYELRLPCLVKIMSVSLTMFTSYIDSKR